MRDCGIDGLRSCCTMGCGRLLAGTLVMLRGGGGRVCGGSFRLHAAPLVAPCCKKKSWVQKWVDLLAAVKGVSWGVSH